jgi:hypothetical protein
MPKYLLCEEGPMGGISIIGVADSFPEALELKIELTFKQEPPRKLVMFCRFVPRLNPLDEKIKPGTRK